MNIIHRISYNNTARLNKIFSAHGIKLKGDIVRYFDIGENDTKWKDIQLIVKKNDKDIIDNQMKILFSKAELSSSKYFVMIPTWHFLYPQPENNFGYQNTTYNSSNVCNSCGQGLIKQDLFCIKTEPKWGNKDIGQLNWIFDEYFVTKKLKCMLEKRFRMHFLPVKKYKTDNLFDTIFNLEINSSVHIKNQDRLQYTICPICGKKKFRMCTDSFFPKITEMDSCISRTKEYFGSGYSAYKQIIINKELYLFFTQNNIKGVDFIPVC
ncbi:hypothetical protein HMPREF1221_01360 [Treponema socranskii subsp. paredis ATCC 35535]|nr:hypothetical protein HMPREF1221_01360 [Treponema socranskii subsp. paredis ATCC 35535]